MSHTNMQFPHRRYDPLRGGWVLVSPHRTQRPWQGEVSRTDPGASTHYDPQCYLCPGNARAGGKKNPQYSTVFVFDNDYAALLPEAPEIVPDPSHPLLRAETERGVCRVLCFHPDHSLTLARMTVDEIFSVVQAWAAQWSELGAKPEIGYVQIFENRGAMMGASNPHPHCQIWATGHVPDDPGAETINQIAYRAQHGACLLCDTLKTELSVGERIVCENDEFVALVPFWAVWPFETLLLSRAHLTGMDLFSRRQQRALAEILKRLTTRYDNLFQTSFPYTMGFHQRPTDGGEHPEWHFHGHFYPPLLRSATVRKFMVGFEMLGMPQRDITPESAAERLRELPERHYLDNANAVS
ncbi:MAG TPA: UDP-glucose--hexose-1-phosphate uridylyltransferase [Acidobacteriaceae bacterium]